MTNKSISIALVLLGMHNYIQAAPVIPSALGNTLGNLFYKAYNGTTLDVGAAIQGYYGIVGSGPAAPDVTMPGNVGFSTVPTISATNNLTAALLVASDGKVGMGNFIPGTGTNNGLPNAVLNIEGNNTASANSALHVGARTTPINALVSGTAYSAQYDGNLYDAGYAQFQTALTVTSAFNSVQATFIRQADLPLTISTPGLYVLAENLTYTSAITAITINASASGTVFDLNDFTITGGGLGTPGFSIAANTTDLTIRNGTIRAFSAGITTGSNLARCIFENINIVGCGQQGIFINGGSAIVIFNCGVYRCGTNEAFATPRGISLGSVSDTQIIDCIVDSCGNVANVNTFSCYEVTSTGTNVQFLNCLATSCQGSSFVGFSVDPTNGALLQYCDSSGHTATNSSDSYLIGPFSEIVNCSAINSNITTDASIRGFNCSESSVIQGCIVAGLTTPRTCNAYFQDRFGTTTNTAYLNCISYGQSSTGLLAGVSAVRDYAFFDSSNMLVSRCISFGGSSVVANQNWGVNFEQTLSTGRNTLVTNNIICGKDQAVYLNLTGTATNTQNQIIENIAASCPTPYNGMPAGSFQSATTSTINTQLTKPFCNVAIN